MSIRINNKIIAGNSSEAKSTSYRYVGEIFQSTIPIDDIKVACLDGHKIYADDGYGSFVQYLISQSLIYPQIVCTEEEWQEKVGQYGSWGKFVINTQENSVRLPKIAGFVQGTVDISSLADLIEAGLPNIEGTFTLADKSIVSGYGFNVTNDNLSGCFTSTAPITNVTNLDASGGGTVEQIPKFDASLSNPIYGNSDTVQPQAIQYPYYIVLATGVVQEINIKDEVHLNNPFFFGMYQYFETEPNNLSWLKSEGQWNNGGIYESFYEWLVNSYNDTESGVSVKLNTETYTNFDYILNQNDKTFRLPIEVKQKFYNDISGSIPVAGNGMTLGLTNGSVDGGLAIATDASFSVYENALGTPTGYDYTGGAPTNTISYGVTTDPTKSGIEAQITQTEVEGLGLYFYVGETVEGANVINGKKVLDILPKKLEKEDIYKGITNCLLEVPQNIKLELKDGVLTLKAGSKVIVPNGFEEDGTTPKFDELIIESDVVSEDVSKNGIVFVTYHYDYIALNYVNDSISGAGATTTTAYTLSYNTTTNILSRYSNNTTIDGHSFPVALCTSSSGSGITSIDQVFNGMGYVGSTIWVDKGIKYLVPNGRNEDGSLNNIEVETSSIYIGTLSSTYNRVDSYINVKPNSSILDFPKLIWNEQTNKNYYSNGSITQRVSIGHFSGVNGKITDFKPYQPFRALDYNDKQEIISWGTPDYNAGVTLTSTLKASPYSFTPPCDGIIRFHVSGEQCWLISRKSASDTSTWAFYIDGATGVHTSSFLPVNRGETIYCVEQRTGHSAIFYPYKGAK